MHEFLTGDKLFGDDFTIEQIQKWYEEEAEAYADLEDNKNRKDSDYGYHELNKLHGFNKIKSETLDQVLGFGSAWGYEFAPIVSKINNLTIIDPSDNLVNNKIGHLTPKYVKPEVNGKLIFNENSFDLITCFGTLHHVPNVSFVVKELYRVLKPGGYLLIREPINSMGDWTKPRPGLTVNERGIPVSIFDAIFKEKGAKIVSKQYCLTMTSFLQRKIGNKINKKIFTYKSYIALDRFLSKLLKNNVKYDPNTKWERISPTSIFYVISK